MPFSMKLLVTATDELFDIIPQKLLYNNFYILLQLLPVKNKKRTSRGIRLLSNCDQNPVHALSSQTNKKKRNLSYLEAHCIHDEILPFFHYTPDPLPFTGGLLNLRYPRRDSKDSKLPPSIHPSEISRCMEQRSVSWEYNFHGWTVDV